MALGFLAASDPKIAKAEAWARARLEQWVREHAVGILEGKSSEMAAGMRRSAWAPATVANTLPSCPTKLVE